MIILQTEVFISLWFSPKVMKAMYRLARIRDYIIELWNGPKYTVLSEFGP